MKTNWQTKKLGEICDFYNGLWKGKKPPYIEVGVIRNTNFTKDGDLNDSDIAYLEVEKKQFENRKLTYGDIILEKSGGGPKQPVGRVVVFNKKEGDFSFSNFTSAIRVKKSSELDFNFLHRFLFFSYISGITEKMQSHSTGIRNLDSKLYKNIEIPFPPLPEQHRIVKILDEVFADVTKAKENAEKNLQNAKELFESFLQSVFVNSEKGWEKKRLIDVCKEIIAGGDKPKDYFSKFKTDTFQIPIFSNGIKSEGLYGYTNIARIKKPSITISARGTIGYSVIRKEAFFPIIRLIVLTPNDDLIDLDFLHYSIKSNSIIGNGTSIPQLTVPAVKKIKILLPKSLKNQKLIVKRLDELSNQTKKLEAIYKQKLIDLEELKKSVLKKAFEGEL
ncbi:MAG: restriction endonuclease subunit S [Candidatus Pacebacteria bacterium]|nr:restriction endonuclease subunit S [Candidatus Paceibacterota bacterium]